MGFVTGTCAGEQMGWPGMPRTLVSHTQPTLPYVARSSSVDHTELSVNQPYKRVHSCGKPVGPIMNTAQGPSISPILLQCTTYTNTPGECSIEVKHWDNLSNRSLMLLNSTQLNEPPTKVSGIPVQGEKAEAYSYPRSLKRQSSFFF